MTGRIAGLVLCAALAACGKGDTLANGQSVPALSLSKVQWDSSDGGVGNVEAVTELQENVYVFSDQGAQIFAGGTQLSVDSTVGAWTGAATIPAADGNGSWAVGLDQGGKLWQVRASGSLESISDRYGLSAEAVQGLAALGGSFTAFTLAGGFAVSDGTTVTRYEGIGVAIAGAQGRAAWAQDGSVRRFDPAKGVLEQWSLPGVKLVTMNQEGRIAAATNTQLYYEFGTLDLNLAYSAAPGMAIDAVVGAGSRFWFATGGRLGVLEHGTVQRSKDAPAAAGFRLFGSPSGDAWLSSGGSLTRYSGGAGGDFAKWQQTVLPIFSRVCSSCHLPTGTAGVDLASYERWKAKRALIYQRVVDHNPSPMPPAGAGVTLSPEDLAAIKAWAGPVG